MTKKIFLKKIFNTHKGTKHLLVTSKYRYCTVYTVILAYLQYPVGLPVDVTNLS